MGLLRLLPKKDMRGAGAKSLSTWFGLVWFVGKKLIPLRRPWTFCFFPFFPLHFGAICLESSEEVFVSCPGA